MIRPNPTDAGEFRLRGKDVSRLEALSDGVFALALTLLIVAVEVPSSFDDLVNVFRGFPAFAVCFAVLIWFWHTHYEFFRRYGLTDGPTVVLNSALLFLVLFYVYPLKFVFSLFLAGLLGLGAAQPATMRADQASTVFVMYSGGFAAVWLVFGLMHVHAYRLRDRLELNPLERLLTRAQIGIAGARIAVALLSVAIALAAPERVAWAGWVYVLFCPIETAHGMSVSRRTRLLATRSSGPPSGTAHPPPG